MGGVMFLSRSIEVQQHVLKGALHVLFCLLIFYWHPEMRFKRCVLYDTDHSIESLVEIHVELKTNQVNLVGLGWFFD